MREFEARWIDTFIRVVHQHRERIGTATLVQNSQDYIKALQASVVTLSFHYPFFYEKRTPVSHEKCLVRYLCTYTVKATPLMADPRVTLKISIPVVTTYPIEAPEMEGRVFGQLSIITLEVEPRGEIFAEDLIDLVDRHALAPIYSFLTVEDQIHLINKIHSQNKSSVVVLGEIRDELAHDANIKWYTAASANFGMLHSYSTVIGTEKSMWVPFSGDESDEI